MTIFVAYNFQRYERHTRQLSRMFSEENVDFFSKKAPKKPREANFLLTVLISFRTFVECLGENEYSRRSKTCK